MRTRDAAGGLVEALASMLGLGSVRGYGAAGVAALADIPGRGAGHVWHGRSHPGGAARGVWAGPSSRDRLGREHGRSSRAERRMSLGGLSGGRCGAASAGAMLVGRVRSAKGWAGSKRSARPGSATPCRRCWHGSFGLSRGGWDGMLWGRSFAAPLGERRRRRWRRLEPLHGVGRGRPAVVQRVAGRGPLQRRHALALRGGGRPYRFADWLAGAALGRSWGSADYTASVGRGDGGASDDAADERVSVRAGPGVARPRAVGHRRLRPG